MVSSTTLIRPCLRATSRITSTSTSMSSFPSYSPASFSSAFGLLPQQQAATAASPLPPQTSRLFSTSPQAQAQRRRPRQARVPDSELPIPSVSGKTGVAGVEIPPYPMGRRQMYHQSNTGLYGAARIRFGNNVSARNEVKTRRKWRPNVQRKRLWSASLGTMVRTRLTTRVLRTVDKLGGLDEYLLGGKTGRIADLGPWGWMLRWRIMQTPAVKARFAAERAALGLPPKTDGDDDEARSVGDAMHPLPGFSGVTAEEMLATADKMLAEDKDFTIQLEGEEVGSEEEPVRASGKAAEVKETGFMSEIDPRKA